MSDRPMLTVQDCARRLTVGPGRIRRLCQSGELVASKVGRDWRVDPDNLDAFVAKRQPVQPEPPAADSALPGSERYL